MNAQPLVSIVIANFNYDRFLPQAIDSALGQTYPHVEVIVVDDGSTDRSPAVLADYGSAIRAIFKSNGGHASTLNAGFAASRGELVLFLDADDMLLPHAIERVVAAYRPGVSKIQFRLDVVDAEGAPLGRQLPPAEYRLPTGDERATILKGKAYPCPPTSGNAFARWALQRLMPVPEERWKNHVDTYQSILAGLFGQVASIAEPCGLYRVHGSNDWALGPKALEVEYLARVAEHAFRRTALLEEWAGRMGLPVGRHAALQYPGELSRLLALKRLAPHHGPIARFGAGWLAWRGIVAIVDDPHPSRLPKRLAGIGWMVAMALLPRSGAIALAERTFVPRRRPAPSLAPQQA